EGSAPRPRRAPARQGQDTGNHPQQGDGVTGGLLRELLLLLPVLPAGRGSRGQGEGTGERGGDGLDPRVDEVDQQSHRRQDLTGRLLHAPQSFRSESALLPSASLIDGSTDSTGDAFGPDSVNR